MSLQERVSLVPCPPSTEDAEVMRRTQQAIELLGDYGRALRSARKIAVKINAGVRRVILTEGKQTELTEPAVVEGVVRAIREVTQAEIVIGDAPTDDNADLLYPELGLPERLAKYPNVRLLDFRTVERVEVPMTHPYALFRRYTLPCELADADAFVSVAKMKAHSSMGCTLCIKNLFGWIPTAVYGNPRLYLHDRLIRLPRVLLDLASWTRPCLNVVDGIVAANKSEWHGTPLQPGVILAGTNIVATDSVGMRVMGFDPGGDYPDHPFFYRRNVTLLAAEAGLGPNQADQIEVIGPTPESVCIPFTVERYRGNTDRDNQIRRGAVCVAHYREQQEALARRYRDNYLAFRDDEIVWEGPDMQTILRQEWESDLDWRNVPQFVVRCLPPEEEVEQMDWYAAEAERLLVASA